MPIKHIVLFAFNGGAPVDSVVAAFADLRTIPGITAFEAGVNNSPENLNKGLSHSFVVTFAGAAERDAYLVRACCCFQCLSVVKTAARLSTRDSWLRVSADTPETCQICGGLCHQQDCQHKHAICEGRLRIRLRSIIPDDAITK
eukprot:SAG31_NODE_1631_length_7698_cov_2.501908_7_plen_144_part_00